MIHINRIFLINVLCGVLLSACVAQPATPVRTREGVAAVQQVEPPEATTASGEVAFEIVSEGASLIGAGDKPITLALRGDEPARNPNALNGLPPEAKTALERQLARRSSDLYLAIYSGPVGSSGYHVKINSITTQQDGGREQLLVRYSLQAPQSGTGAATVITYPFAIVRISGVNVEPGDVVFESEDS